MTSHQKAIRTNFLAFAKSWAIWMSNPVSERGAAHVYQMVYAAGGPQLRKMCDAMREHPVGSRLLRERPDLGALLGDYERLSSMPTGSLGHAYSEFVSRPDILPGYLLAGLAYRDGVFDRLEWPDDMKWLVERLSHTHDLTHALSGYGSDLAGEALNINFTLGILDLPVLELFAREFGVGSAIVLSPKVGRARWRRLMREAYERGRAFGARSPFHCIPFEEILPLPVAEARSQLGVPPLSDGSHTLDTSDWLSNGISRQIATGFGAMDRAMAAAKNARELVEAGLTPRELMSASEKTRRRLDQMRREGATVEQLVAAARAHAC